MNSSIFFTPSFDQEAFKFNSSDFSQTSLPKTEAVSDFYFNKSLLSAKKEESSIPGSWTRSERLKTLRRFSRMMLDGSEKTQKVRDLCPICLGNLDQNEGHLKCSHVFCLTCIKNWAQYTNTCPLCKEEFLQISKKGLLNQQEIIKIEPKKLDFDEETDDELSETDEVCEICEKNDNDHLLLICDKCNFFVCHTYCMNPPLDRIPEEEWFCSQCSRTQGNGVNIVRNNRNAIRSVEEYNDRRSNLRERLRKNQEKKEQKNRRILTRSCYVDKTFEYQELKEENFLHELEAKRRQNRRKEKIAKENLGIQRKNIKKSRFKELRALFE